MCTTECVVFLYAGMQRRDGTGWDTPQLIQTNSSSGDSSLRDATHCVNNNRRTASTVTLWAHSFLFGLKLSWASPTPPSEALSKTFGLKRLPKYTPPEIQDSRITFSFYSITILHARGMRTVAAWWRFELLFWVPAIVFVYFGGIELELGSDWSHKNED